jgi:hypothetical protein
MITFLIHSKSTKRLLHIINLTAYREKRYIPIYQIYNRRVEEIHLQSILRRLIHHRNESQQKFCTYKYFQYQEQISRFL